MKKSKKLKKFKFVTRIESTYDIEAENEDEALKKALNIHEGIVVGYKGEGELPSVEVPSFFVSTPERVISVEDLNDYYKEHSVNSVKAMDKSVKFGVVCRFETVWFSDRKHADEYCDLYSRWVKNFQPYIITRYKVVLKERK